ncbi:hypothetical protein WME90_22385 [Sorangium sp. So ce375]|uniref:hypothetical protein n=1 Tax=Sorangium sp. So ce375 TaxID=3133306 RepID=UPI003F5B5A87
MNKQLFLSLAIACILTVSNARASAPQVTVMAAKDLRQMLDTGSVATLYCGGQGLPGKDPRNQMQLTTLKDAAACALDLRWSRSAEVDDVVATPKKVVIIKKGSVSPTDYLFEYPLGNAGVASRQFQSQEWFRADKFVHGQEYNIWIIYGVSQKAPAAGADPAVSAPVSGPKVELDDQVVPVYHFKPVKSRWAWQATGKVFTAWEMSESDNRSFIVPGLAAGGAWRIASDYNDQDVIGLRAVVAAGPNLVPKLQSTTDADGNTTTTTAPQKLQLLAGLELVLARYASVGLIWIPLGGNSSSRGTPLFLLTYGELYPSISSK